MTKQQKTITAAVVAIIGVIAIVIAIIYYTVEAKSLPSFLGQLHGYTGHRSRRGLVALIVGIVLVAAGGGLFFYKPGGTGQSPGPGAG